LRHQYCLHFKKPLTRWFLEQGSPSNPQLVDPSFPSPVLVIMLGGTRRSVFTVVLQCECMMDTVDAWTGIPTHPQDYHFSY